MAEFLLSHTYDCISTYGYISDNKNNLLVRFGMIGMSVELIVPYNEQNIVAMPTILAEIFDTAITTTHIIRIDSAPLFDIEVNCEVRLQCALATSISCDILEIGDNAHIHVPAIVVAREVAMHIFTMAAFDAGIIIEAQELTLHYLFDVTNIHTIFPCVKFVLVHRTNYMQNYIVPLLVNGTSVCIGLVYSRMYICDEHLIYIQPEQIHAAACTSCLTDISRGRNIVTCKFVINKFIESLRAIKIRMPKNANK